MRQNVSHRGAARRIGKLTSGEPVVLRCTTHGQTCVKCFTAREHKEGLSGMGTGDDRNVGQVLVLVLLTGHIGIAGVDKYKIG